MTFTAETWQERAVAKLRKLQQGFKTGDEPYIAYGTIAGLALWPLVEATLNTSPGQSTPISLLLTLGSVAGGGGSNLIAEQLQHWHDQAAPLTKDEVVQWVCENVATEQELREALDNVLEKFEAFSHAHRSLGEEDRAWFIQTLQQELVTLGNLERFQATLEGTDAIAQGEETKALGVRAVGASGSQVGGSTISRQVTSAEHVVERDLVIITEQVSNDFWQQFTRPDASTRPAESPGAALPSSLYRQVKQALLTCGPFNSDRALRALFVDARIASWRTRLPEAGSPGERVEAVVNYLLGQSSTSQENGLVLLLRVLHERTSLDDARRRRLAELVETLPQALASPLPPVVPPSQALYRATTRYLTHIVNRYQFLDFKGMGVSNRIALQMSLVEMYVPLRARIEMPEGKTWARRRGISPADLLLAGRHPSPAEAEAMGARLTEPQPLLDLLRENSGLIVLGDPGSGKTTFLKYLALRLALGQREGLRMGNRLLVLLPLSAYANALAHREIPLHRFIAHYYRALGVEEPLEVMLTEALNRGGALLLLDGLDEVRDLHLRHTVVERVMDFFSYRQQDGNKFVLTSRIVGYREVRPVATSMAECTLVDFDSEEIALFVEKWTAALERAARGESEVSTLEAAQERDELLLSVRRNPGVRRLAANPLLLTILALMKRQGIVLPERRVALYDKYVETLLKHWNLARGLGRPSVRDLDVVETVRVLAPLALWMHETSPGVGLVKREAMRRRLVQIYRQRQVDAPPQAARQLLADAREYAGLLLERGPGEYGFIHLTFQEYLAAVAIAQQGQGEAAKIVKTLTAHLGDDNWREVILLAIGYMGIRQQLDTVATQVLLQLVAQAPGVPGTTVILAGEAVVDAYPGGVTPAGREKVVAALVATMQETAAVAPHNRARAGQVLARLGDPRPEVMTLAGMHFCYVPAGPFWMGSAEDDPLADDTEKPLHQVNLPFSYWLAKYPVTNAQFSVFVQAGGYRQARYWREAKTAGFWREDGFKGVGDSKPRVKPRDYGGSFTLPNHPVVGITWYEALAFCRWLTAKWRRDGMLPQGWAVQLPSEAEWEKAARGGLEIPIAPLIHSIPREHLEPEVSLSANPWPRRLYPWGDEAAAPHLANYRKTGIIATSGLGCFTDGISPYGCEALSGNVFEWTRSLWGERDFDKRTLKQRLAYPYEIGGEREVLGKGTEWTRVIRGGSWIASEGWLRCAYRDWISPLYWFNHLGFRVMVARVPIMDSYHSKADASLHAEMGIEATPVES